MRRMVLILALLVAAPAGAEEVVAGLSSDRIAITTDFAGSEILIFGAVKREKPIPRGSALQVIVTVEGPSAPVTVRRKARQMGIWVNTEAVTVDRAPSFYAVATTAPFASVLSQTEDLRHAVSIPRAIRSVGAPMAIADSQSYSRALIRLRERDDLYVLSEGRVYLAQDTLFTTRIKLPANLVEGNYKTRIFLTRDRTVIALHEALIGVRKTGLERWLFDLSRSDPLTYGILSLVIAIFAGWAASAAFRLIRV